MTFRRIIIEHQENDQFELLRNDIDSYLTSNNFLNKYPNLKVINKPSVKEYVFIIDFKGEGADSVSKKVKNLTTKYNGKAKIRNQVKLIPKI